MTAATVLALLALVGCGADVPVADHTPSSTMQELTPTPSPSPTLDLTRLPERPDAMSEPTADGALAAATYVLQLYGYTFASGDTAPWRAITLDTCSFCSKVAETVEEIEASGDRSSGSTMTVDSTRSVEISEDRWFAVDLQVTQGPSQRFDGDDEIVSSDPGGRYRAVFALSWSEGWRVDQMGFRELATDDAAAEG